MILGVIADDFTGASDIAGVLAQAGMRTAFLPSPKDIPACTADAGVVALKTRTAPAEDAVANSLEVLDGLLRAGCRQIYFKYCSTFDSTRAGNIGPVAEALARRLGSRRTVVCPSFPANRRTVYQGNLFIGSVPLAESGMREHPLTPMIDSDVRRWLGYQSSGPVGHIPHEAVTAGSGEIRKAMDLQEGLIVVDATSDEDLLQIALAVRDDILVTGGSALAQGLPRNYRDAGLSLALDAGPGGTPGPAIILAGSCSEATRAQVDRYRATRPALGIDVGRLLAGGDVFDEASRFAAEHVDSAPLIFSSAAPEVANRGERAAAAIEALLAALAVDAVGRGVTRVVVAGGETSGAVVEALAPGPLELGPAIAPGVPAMVGRGLALALKSGNFGGSDFFSEAVMALGERT